MAQQSVWSLLGMLVVVVLILVFAYFVTRWLGNLQSRGYQTKVQSRDKSKFCVLGQLSVGRNERLVLVRLQDRCCLLGVTAGSITLLKELGDADSSQFFAENNGSVSPGFAELLKENLRKRK